MNSYFSGMPLKLKEKNISNKRAGKEEGGLFSQANKSNKFLKSQLAG